MTRALMASDIILAGCIVALSATGALATCVQASWYGTESGNRTANGERFDGTSMTAAHRSLPFGTKLRVTYKGKSAGRRSGRAAISTSPALPPPSSA